MNLTNYEQSKALAALGYPQEGNLYETMVAIEQDHITSAYRLHYGLLANYRHYPVATDVHSAIMWLLASERGRKLWGDESYVTTHCNGSATIGVPGAGLLGVTAEGDFPTPAALLDAMLAAVTEASDA